MSARLLFVGLVAMVLAGCARYVVIDPDLVASRNARDWTIRREPAGATANAATPPAPPPAIAR